MNQTPTHHNRPTEKEDEVDFFTELQKQNPLYRQLRFQLKKDEALPCPSGSFPITPAQLRELMNGTSRRRTRASTPSSDKPIRINITIPQPLKTEIMTKHGKEYSEDEYEDFNWLLREVLRLIAKWTDPDHPEGRYPKTPFKVNEDLVMKLEDMMEPRGSMQRKQLPEDIKNAILQITSQLYAIIDTIDNPKDPIWKSNPYPYNQPAK